MKKRVAAIFLIIGIIAGTISSCGRAPGNHVTRGEWIAMLADGFGLSDSNNTEPYYQDVTAQHNLFPAVQSLGDWDILAPLAGDTLGVDKPVTRQEAAATAAIAAGFQIGEDFELGQAVDFSTQYGIMEPEGGMPTKEECQAAVEAALAVYLESPGEEQRVAVMNTELVDLGNLPLDVFLIGDGTVSLPAVVIDHVAQDNGGNHVVSIRTGNGIVQLSAGKTFVIAPEANEAWGQAYKVTSVQVREDGSVLFETTSPSLGDVYDKLEVHTTAGLEDAYITWADGVMAEPVNQGRGLSSGAGEYRVELLSNNTSHGYGGVRERSEPQHKITIPLDYSDKTAPFIEKLAESLDNGEAVEALKKSGFTYGRTPSIQDFKGLADSARSWTEELDKDADGPWGYELGGDLTVGLSVITDLSYDRLDYEHEDVDWPPSASLVINAYVTGNVIWKGTYELEHPIAEIDIPLVDGLSVRGSLILYASANGHVDVKVDLHGWYRSQWRDKGENSSYRRPVGTNSATADIDGAIEFSCDAGAALDLCFFKIKIIGAELKVGGVFEPKGAVVGSYEDATNDGVTSRTYTESLQLSLEFYAPIVSVKVSGPEHLAEVLGLEKDFPIIGKEDATHVTLYQKDIPFWSKTVELDEAGEPILNGPMDGDFSEFAGEYRMADEELEIRYANYCTDCPNIILHEDGRITLTTQPQLEESRSYYPYETNVVPSLIREVFPERSELPDGSFYEYGAHGYRCVLWESPDYERLKDEVEMAPGEFYTIYPDGLSWPSDDGVCIEYHRGVGTADDSYGYYIKVN